MRSFTVFTLATASAATQIPFFMPGMGSLHYDAPVASIVEADPSTTVMALACPTSKADSDECPWGELDITVTVVAKTGYAVSVPAAQVTFDCTSKGDMTCTAAIAQEYTDAGMDGFTAGSDGTATGTTVYPSSEVVLQTASVTAGQEKLSAGAGAVSDGASSTAKESSASAKETGASSAESTLKTTGSAAASTGASPSSTGPSATGAPSSTSAAPEQATGAAARFGIEGAALVALVGAAAVQVL